MKHTYAVYKWIAGVKMWLVSVSDIHPVWSNKFAEAKVFDEVSVATDLAYMLGGDKYTIGI